MTARAQPEEERAKEVEAPSLTKSKLRKKDKVSDSFDPLTVI